MSGSGIPRSRGRPRRERCSGCRSGPGGSGPPPGALEPTSPVAPGRGPGHNLITVGPGGQRRARRRAGVTLLLRSEQGAPTVGQGGIMAHSIGRIGAWQGPAAATVDLARGLEALGFGALWIGGSPGGDLGQVEQLLDATTSLVLATGIVNIWKDGAQPIAAAWHRIARRHPGRFLLGIGVGHPEAIGARYATPYTAMESYLDDLDRADVPVGER